MPDESQQGESRGGDDCQMHRAAESEKESGGVGKDRDSDEWQREVYPAPPPRLASPIG